MIIAHIIGGLGNQMFQYAACLALSKSKGVELKLDLRDFDSYKLHNGYELSRVFKGPFSIAEPNQIKQILGWRDSKLIRQLLIRQRLNWLRGKSFIVSPYFHYWSDFFNIPTNSYLIGYWQSEKYFKHITLELRSAFQFRTPLEDLNKSIATNIEKGNSVSIHIRRGDYATNSKNTSIYGVIPLSYYEKAIEFISGKIKNPRFFIFSDDIQWAQENIQTNHPIQFIGHNRKEQSYIDMQLMSLCDHHIIANSSFSWWGAWLNPKPEKIVVYPKKWFAGGGLDSRDLFPEDWISL